MADNLPATAPERAVATLPELRGLEDKFTPNLNLEKPLETEYYDISVFNANSDKIDAAYGEKITSERLANEAVTPAKLSSEVKESMVTAPDELSAGKVLLGGGGKTAQAGDYTVDGVIPSEGFVRFTFTGPGSVTVPIHESAYTPTFYTLSLEARYVSGTSGQIGPNGDDYYWDGGGYLNLPLNGDWSAAALSNIGNTSNLGLTFYAAGTYDIRNIQLTGPDGNDILDHAAFQAQGEYHPGAQDTPDNHLLPTLQKVRETFSALPVPDGSVGAAQLAPEAVTAAHFAPGALDSRADQPYETASGYPLHITDSAGGLASDMTVTGNTVQQGTPAPDAPADIQTITGLVSITINSASHTVPLTSATGETLELCKVGNTADTIEKRDGVWGVCKAVGKTAFNGSERWAPYTTTTSGVYRRGISLPGVKAPAANVAGDILCGHFPAVSVDKTYKGTQGISIESSGAATIFKADDAAQDLTAWKAWLADRSEAGSPVTVYYALTEPAWIPLCGEAQAVLNSMTTLPTGTVDVSSADALPPASVSMTYRQDLQAYIKGLHDSWMTAMAQHITDLDARLSALELTNGGN